MKVAFYINAINGGGAARVMTVLANHLSDNGHDVVLVTSYPCEREYQLETSIARINLEEERIEDSFLKRNVRRVLRLRKTLRESKPDILVAFMAEPNLRALAATVGMDIPTVVSVRNDPCREYASVVLKCAARLLFKRAAWTVFQTPDAQRFFSGSILQKSSVIFNPVDSSFFEEEWNPEPGLVVTCGRLTDQKNQRMLIEAFSHVVEMVPHARLEIYGEGELKDALKSQIHDLGLDGKATLKGYVTDVPKALSSASVFVLPSKYEGMPNALMEAMAIGVPSVATDCPCGGSRLLIDNDVNGRLVAVNDTVSLLDAITQFLCDEKLSKRISEKARNDISSYTPLLIMGQWEQLLLNAINAR